MKRYRIQVYRAPDANDSGWVSIHTVEYHPELLERFASLGVVVLKDGRIHRDDIRRLKRLIRLRNRLGVNLSGAAIILDLLDKIEELRREIRRLEQEQKR
jgi:MerR family transcriptional regulator/heat shock protein HspR